MIFRHAHVDFSIALIFKAFSIIRGASRLVARAPITHDRLGPSGGSAPCSSRRREISEGDRVNWMRVRFRLLSGIDGECDMRTGYGATCAASRGEKKAFFLGAHRVLIGGRHTPVDGGATVGRGAGGGASAR